MNRLHVYTFYPLFTHQTYRQIDSQRGTGGRWGGVRSGRVTVRPRDRLPWWAVPQRRGRNTLVFAALFSLSFLASRRSWILVAGSRVWRRAALNVVPKCVRVEKGTCEIGRLILVACDVCVLKMNGKGTVKRRN